MGGLMYGSPIYIQKNLVLFFEFSLQGGNDFKKLYQRRNFRVLRSKMELKIVAFREVDNYILTILLLK